MIYVMLFCLYCKILWWVKEESKLGTQSFSSPRIVSAVSCLPVLCSYCLIFILVQSVWCLVGQLCNFQFRVSCGSCCGAIFLVLVNLPVLGTFSDLHFSRLIRRTCDCLWSSDYFVFLSWVRCAGSALLVCRGLQVLFGD